MISILRQTLGVLAGAMLLSGAFAGGAAAQSFSAPQRAEIETIIKDYLIKHPEVLEEVMKEMEKRQTAAEAEKQQKTISENSETLFNSPKQIALGNPKGDVTLVEFFDYNCGYCKRALSDMQDLLKTDPNLRVVLRDFPVLGEGSVQAAQVAIALKMQTQDPKKYFDFHQKLLGGRGAADKAKALAVAKEIGADMARLEKDMASPEIKATMEETFKLAEPLGLTGTPSYVVGKDVVVGAVGAGELKTKINTTRCGKATC